MTGNAQVGHRKYFIFFALTTGGQFESLQDMIPEGRESNQEIFLFLDGENCLHFHNDSAYIMMFLFYKFHKKSSFVKKKKFSYPILKMAVILTMLLK